MLQRWARVGLWGGILLLHVPAAIALLTSITSAESSTSVAVAIPRVLGMLSSCALFALKAADVSWLRIPLTKRNVFIAILILGFVHLGALDKARDGSLEVSPFVLGWVIVCSATSAVSNDLAGCIYRFARRFFGSRTSGFCRMCALALVLMNRHVRPAYVYGFGALRAPPLF